MKKKIIALGLSLVSVCIILTGCAGLGKTESSTKAPESSSSQSSSTPVYTLPPAGGSSSASAGSSTNSSTHNSSAGVSVTPNVTYTSVPGSSTPAAGSANTALGSYTINTQTDPLSLKLKPSKDAATIVTVPKGTKVEVLAVQNGWGYIVYNTTGGWVSMQYLKTAA